MNWVFSLRWVFCEGRCCGISVLGALGTQRGVS
jgi:hypothetical protein